METKGRCGRISDVYFNALGVGKPEGFRKLFLPQLAASYFVCTRASNKVQTEEKSVCPGRGDNEAPIGWPLLKHFRKYGCDPLLHI